MADSRLCFGIAQTRSVICRLGDAVSATHYQQTTGILLLHVQRTGPKHLQQQAKHRCLRQCGSTYLTGLEHHKC